MKLDSYWNDSLLALPATQDQSLPAQVDVAIVGGGFTGLSAALALAQRGARVVVLEAGPTVAAEASGRNGGHVNNGLAVDYADVAARVGVAQARAWYHAYDDAVDTVERLVQQEGIDCDFLRHGKLKLATQDHQMQGLRRSAERLVADSVDIDVEVLDAQRVQSEVQSERFRGGLLYKRSAQMHMGRFANGLAQAALRHGAQIHTSTTVQRIERVQGQVHRLHTPGGVVRANQVLLATGASRHGSYGSFGWLRRRIVPIGSFMVVTEPLGAERANALLAQRRTYTTIANIHNYFRLTPDHRLLFGGRARFAISSPQSDATSGEILRAGLAATFPQLGRVRLDYCWGGLVDVTQDRLPQAGERDGLFYSMGYSGHGTQMSVHMGQCMAEVMAGNQDANPWKGRSWPAIPGHFGPPWFLPAVGLYFRLKDKLQRLS